MLIELDRGDVLVNEAQSGNTYGIVFRNSVFQHAPGFMTEAESKLEIDEFDNQAPFIVMSFSNIASIEVVELALATIKAMILAKSSNKEKE